MISYFWIMCCPINTNKKQVKIDQRLDDKQLSREMHAYRSIFNFRDTVIHFHGSVQHAADGRADLPKEDDAPISGLHIGTFS